MKKIFKLNVANKTIERQADSIQHEIKKILTKLNKRSLGDQGDYWDFECLIGPSEAEAQPVHARDIRHSVQAFVDKKCDEFFLSIDPKATKRRQDSK